MLLLFMLSIDDCGNFTIHDLYMHLHWKATSKRHRAMKIKDRSSYSLCNLTLSEDVGPNCCVGFNGECVFAIKDKFTRSDFLDFSKY